MGGCSRERKRSVCPPACGDPAEDQHSETAQDSGYPPQVFPELCLTLTYQTLGYKLHSGLLVKMLTLHKHLLSMGLGTT